jgi:serpin B
MRKAIIIVFILAGFGLNAQKNHTIESMNAFSFKLLDQLQNNTDNCFFSPFSIYGALSMTYAGAKEQTRLDLEKVLEFSEKDSIIQNFHDLSNSLEMERELSFLSSNSLWSQKNLKIEKSYIKLVQQQYNAKVENVNFAEEKDREKGRLEINQWIDKQTKGNLPNFISKGVLDESTTMILINAVYFNALWNTAFLPENVNNQVFFVSDKDSVGCQMMHLSFESFYFEDDSMQILEIPYQNNKATMLVFLPKKGVSTKNIDYDYYKKVSKSMNSHLINLTFPKFKMQVSYELSDYLKKMGLKSAFEPGADFSGITGNKNLILDKIIHKSILDVSEKGTEAASSTAVISMRSTKLVKDEVNFVANRPFYFLIKQKTENLILFMGYLASPANGGIQVPKN